MEEHGWVPIKLPLWALTFEFDIIFMCHEIFFPDSFSIANRKKKKKKESKIHSSLDLAGWVWPMDGSLLTPDP